eukprot:753242-Hanusia_phi.AAC.6
MIPTSPHEEHIEKDEQHEQYRHASARLTPRVHLPWYTRVPRVAAARVAIGRACPVLGRAANTDSFHAPPAASASRRAPPALLDPLPDACGAAGGDAGDCRVVPRVERYARAPVVIEFEANRFHASELRIRSILHVSEEKIDVLHESVKRNQRTSGACDKVDRRCERSIQEECPTTATSPQNKK